MRVLTWLWIWMLPWGVVNAALVWEPAPARPMTRSAEAGGQQGHHGRGGGKPFLLQGGEDADIQLWLPTGGRRVLEPDADGQVRVPGSGMDNYHLLMARKQSGDTKEVALRYVYMHGKPSGESPASLVNMRKAELEVVPAPLPREHQRYLSQRVFDFIVRYQGEPVESQPVQLRTGNGTQVTHETDRRGRVSFRLPDDFTEVTPGRRNNAPAEFVVTTGMERMDERYVTTLSAAYYVNPSHWRSTAGAALAMSIGMISGLVVLRRYRGEDAQRIRRG